MFNHEERDGDEDEDGDKDTNGQQMLIVYM